MSRQRKLAKRKTNIPVIVASTIVILGVIAGLVLGVLPLLFQAPIQVEVPPTSFEFDCFDITTDKTLDCEVDVYRVLIEGKTQAEIDDLTPDEYELDDTVDSDRSYTPEDDYAYLVNIQDDELDYVPELFIPKLGINSIGLLNTSDNAAILAYSKNEHRINFEETEERDWELLITMLDEENKSSGNHGIKPFYSFGADEYVYPMITILFNTTAKLNFGELQDVNIDSKESVKGNELRYLINETIIGSSIFSYRFGLNLDTEFEVLRISVGLGTSEQFLEQLYQDFVVPFGGLEQKELRFIFPEKMKATYYNNMSGTPILDSSSDELNVSLFQFESFLGQPVNRSEFVSFFSGSKPIPADFFTVGFNVWKGVGLGINGSTTVFSVLDYAGFNLMSNFRFTPGNSGSDFFNETIGQGGGGSSEIRFDVITDLSIPDEAITIDTDIWELTYHNSTIYQNNWTTGFLTSYWDVNGIIFQTNATVGEDYKN